MSAKRTICIAMLALACAGCIDNSYLDNSVKVRKLAVAGRCEAAWKLYETAETGGWTDEEILKYCPARPGLTP